MFWLLYVTALATPSLISSTENLGQTHGLRATASSQLPTRTIQRRPLGITRLRLRYAVRRQYCGLYESLCGNQCYDIYEYQCCSDQTLCRGALCCEYSAGSTYTTSTSYPSASISMDSTFHLRTAVIIGIAIAGIAFLIIIVLTVWLFCCLKSRRKRRLIAQTQLATEERDRATQIAHLSRAPSTQDPTVHYGILPAPPPKNTVAPNSVSPPPTYSVNTQGIQNIRNVDPEASIPGPMNHSVMTYSRHVDDPPPHSSQLPTVATYFSSTGSGTQPADISQTYTTPHYAAASQVSASFQVPGTSPPSNALQSPVIPKPPVHLAPYAPSPTSFTYESSTNPDCLVSSLSSAETNQPFGKLDQASNQSYAEHSYGQDNKPGIPRSTSHLHPPPKPTFPNSPHILPDISELPAKPLESSHPTCTPDTAGEFSANGDNVDLDKLGKKRSDKRSQNQGEKLYAAELPAENEWVARQPESEG